MLITSKIQTTKKLKWPKFIFAVFCGESLNWNDDLEFLQDHDHFLNH